MIKKHLALILFFSWSLWLSLEFLLGPFSHVRIHDNGDSLLPQLIASKIQFFRYGLSYYADYMASGVDATSQLLLPFSNLNSLLFIFLPPWLAYGLMMFVQRFLASYFTYRLCRDCLKLDILPSVISGFLFSLFNFSIFSFTLYHQLGIPALPLTLWTLEKITKSKNKYILSGLFGLFIGYSNYFIYFAPYILPFIFIWFFYIRKLLKKDLFLNLSIFAVATILIQLPSVMAIISNVKESHRIFWSIPSYPQYLTVVYSLIKTILITNFVPIVLITVNSMLIKKIKDQLRNRLSILSCALITTVFISKIIQPILPQSFGILRTFSIDRFDMIITFILVIASSYILNLSFKTKSPFVSLTAYSLIFVVLILGSLKIKIETVKNYASYRSLYQHPDLNQLESSVGGSLDRVVTVTGGGARSSYPLAYGLSTVDTYLTLYPAGYHQYWQKIISNRISDDKLRYEDFVNWGNRIYLYGPSNFYNLKEIDFQNYFDLNLLSQANVRYIASQKPLNDQNLSLLPSSYRESIKNWDTFSKAKKIRVFIEGHYFGPPLYIYENLNALPRFFLKNHNGFSSAGVQVQRYRPDKIEIVINDVREPSELIAPNNYYPYWQAMVNGRKSQVKKFQDTFLQVEIPAGSVQVVLEYKPPYAIFQDNVTMLKW